MIESGGDKVWIAAAEEILDYIVCRRHLQIETVSAAPGQESYRLQLRDLPAPVASRQLTVDIDVPANLRRNPFLTLNGQPQPGREPKLGGQFPQCVGTSERPCYDGSNLRAKHSRKNRGCRWDGTRSSGQR